MGAPSSTLTPGKGTVRFADTDTVTMYPVHAAPATGAGSTFSSDPFGTRRSMSASAIGGSLSDTLETEEFQNGVLVRRSGRSGDHGSSNNNRKRRTQSPARAPVLAWPTHEFISKELPTVSATQIMAVRIDKRGGPLGIPAEKKAGSGSTAPAGGFVKQKARGVTLGGWRTGVSAVKHTSTCCNSLGRAVCLAGSWPQGVPLCET